MESLFPQGRDVEVQCQVPGEFWSRLVGILGWNTTLFSSFIFLRIKLKISFNVSFNVFKKKKIFSTRCLQVEKFHGFRVSFRNSFVNQESPSSTLKSLFPEVKVQCQVSGEFWSRLVGILGWNTTLVSSFIFLRIKLKISFNVLLKKMKISFSTRCLQVEKFQDFRVSFRVLRKFRNFFVK